MTREQKRAEKAFTLMKDFQDRQKNAEAAKKKYGTMAHKLPVLVKTAGLTQALHFVDSRGNEHQQELLQHLAEQLKDAQLLQDSKIETLLSKVRQAPLHEYIRLTQETLAVLLWHKRFTQSLYKVDASSDND
jgi:CRISPR-associated protein Cmr5